MPPGRAALPPRGRGSAVTGRLSLNMATVAAAGGTGRRPGGAPVYRRLGLPYRDAYALARLAAPVALPDGVTVVASSASRMDFRILGPLEVSRGHAPLHMAGGKQRALLAILLLNANRTVAREQIIDALWAEDVPDSAQKMVQIHVSQLRKALPEPRLHTRAPGYLLQVGKDELDLTRFERVVADAREALAEGDAPKARELLGDALALWRGPRWPRSRSRSPGTRARVSRSSARQRSSSGSRPTSRSAITATWSVSSKR